MEHEIPEEERSRLKRSSDISQSLPDPIPQNPSRTASDEPPRIRARSLTRPEGRFPRVHSTRLSLGTNKPTLVRDLPSSNSVLGPEATDHVFPVRSVVSMDPTATPLSRSRPTDDYTGTGLVKASDKRRESVQRDATVRDTPPSAHRTSSQPAQDSSNSQDTLSSPHVVPAQGLSAGGCLEANAEKGHAGVTYHELNHFVTSDSSIRSEHDSGTTDGRIEPTHSVADSIELPITARFKHVVTEGGHAIVTGSDGDPVQRCEDEPIHIPGAIQSFGLLIALKEEADSLVVRIVSENSAKLIGYTPHQLFQLSSFLDILSDEQAENLQDHLDFIRDGTATDPAIHGPEVFMLSIRPPHGRSIKCWCAMHIPRSNNELIICELELEDDIHNPLVVAGESDPEPPEDTLGCDYSPEEYAESTVNASKPLRVLRSARKKKSETAAMEVFSIMAQVQEQLADAPTLAQFLKILIGVVKELTGFHRVMIYQFDEEFNGRVVSELVDPRATKDLYMGLNFPASDIPKQARDLYRLNKVRLLYDRDMETARLVCRTTEDLKQPLDMSFAYLRAMSPIHLKYLSNMAVRSSMSISVNAFGELWGLIACHSYGQKGMRVSFPIRKMCCLIGDTASRNIERLSYASRLQARKLINTACTSQNPTGYIVASSEDLLNLFSADCGALSIRDETKLLGKVDNNSQELLAMLEFLRLRKIDTVYASSNINSDFPDLRYSPGIQSIAGLLFVPLSSGGSNFIVFFRKTISKEVKWAGNPYEKAIKEGTEGYLEPRKSFKMWSETVVGTCRDWTEQDIETAAVLCLVYGKFIEVWRQKEEALQSSQLQKILLANSAHEVRTPLNAIINYLEIALEGNLDGEARDNLTRSHSASKSLVYVINDLLDLTKTEQGLELVKEEVFDFHTMLHEATEPFRGDANRKDIDYRVAVLDDVPQLLKGDPRRIRQVISNVIANAIKNTCTGYVAVNVCKSVEQPQPETIEIDFIIEDSGAGMPQEKVDALFSELEQVSSEKEELDSALVAKNEVGRSPTLNAGGATLGLGLAVVARAIRNMNGQLRVRTEEGKGSRFVIQLTMGIPNRVEDTSEAGYNHRGNASPGQATTALDAADEESLLVGECGPRRVWTMDSSRTASEESINSVRSRNSGQRGRSRSRTSAPSGRSDVDRLIDDIKKPHLTHESGTPQLARRRRSSPKQSPRGSTDGAERPITSAPSSPFAVRTGDPKVPGEESVRSSRTPVKAVRIPDEDGLKPQTALAKAPPKVAFQLQEGISGYQPECCSTNNLSILVAEDDPINSKIMKKRLEKLGHRVHLTVNGEECSSALGDQPSYYDAVLMDLQMPIVDGFTSTKFIRSYENSHGKACLSARAIFNGRIPIFAVSASLHESERTRYMESGFDGWILKPVNFQRVEGLLNGIVEEKSRSACLYQPGQWELGGWFEKRCVDSEKLAVDATPNDKPPTDSSHPPPASIAKSQSL